MSVAIGSLSLTSRILQSSRNLRHKQGDCWVRKDIQSAIQTTFNHAILLCVKWYFKTFIQHQIQLAEDIQAQITLDIGKDEVRPITGRERPEGK